MKPDWHKQVLPGWTKYIFYAFLILCAVYFLWPWGLSLTWREWLDNMHRSQRKSHASSLQNSPLFKARFKGAKILSSEPLSIHYQSSPTQWRDELGARFVVESKGKAPSGLRYLTVAEVLESQKNQPYDPKAMGPVFQDLIDSVDRWPGVGEFARNVPCPYGLILYTPSPEKLLTVELSPDIKPKGGFDLIRYSGSFNTGVHLTLVNGMIASARLPLKKPWNQVPQVAAYERALMARGLEPDPDDCLQISENHLLSSHPKGARGDEFNTGYQGDVLAWSSWTEKEVTLDPKDLASVESSLNAAFLRAGLSPEDIQDNLTRTSLSARHQPEWMMGPRGLVDRGQIRLKIAYRYRTGRAWIDTLKPGFQLQPILLPEDGSLIQVGELVLKPLQKTWLIGEGQAKWILASQGADTTHLTVRLFITAGDQQQKGYICLESRVPKPPPPPLKPGEMRCIWDPYWTVWLDLETGKVTKL